MRERERDTQNTRQHRSMDNEGPFFSLSFVSLAAQEEEDQPNWPPSRLLQAFWRAKQRGIVVQEPENTRTKSACILRILRGTREPQPISFIPPVESAPAKLVDVGQSTTERLCVHQKHNFKKNTKPRSMCVYGRMMQFLFCVDDPSSCCTFPTQ